ncbi:MAG: hypothetical protein M1829_005810 [Trizodia sp. TS-e1964]|nr:MAG: hypothetical protein M1829_005810 [Trizodia sp. TS-e1964]
MSSATPTYRQKRPYFSRSPTHHAIALPPAQKMNNLVGLSDVFAMGGRTIMRSKKRRAADLALRARVLADAALAAQAVQAAQAAQASSQAAAAPALAAADEAAETPAEAPAAEEPAAAEETAWDNSGDTGMSEAFGALGMESEPEAEEPEWTNYDDTTLLQMKDANQSWKKIASEINRPMGEIKKRYGELRKANHSHNQHKPSNQSGNEGNQRKQPKGKRGGKGKEPETNWHGEGYRGGGYQGGGYQGGYQAGGYQNNQDQQPEAAEGVAEEEAAAEQAWEEEAKPDIEPDGKWSKDEVELLLRLSFKYDDGKWLSVASRFFDITGRRVSGSDVKSKLTGA